LGAKNRGIWGERRPMGQKKQAKELCAIILVSPKLIKQNLFAAERMK
jgi:hypothetical protein